jgi:hypothetical protein
LDDSQVFNSQQQLDQFETLAGSVMNSCSLQSYFTEDDEDSTAWVARSLGKTLDIHEADPAKPTTEAVSEIALEDLQEAIRALSDASSKVLGVLGILLGDLRPSSRFSLIVWRLKDEDLATVCPISVALLRALDSVVRTVEESLIKHHASGDIQTQVDPDKAEMLFKPVGKAAESVLVHIGLQPDNRPVPTPRLTYNASLQLASSLYLVLLLSVVSYQWSHIGPFDEKHMGEYCERFIIRCGQDILIFRREKLACLNSLLKAPVWAFATHSRQSSNGLCLSTTLSDLVDLWPPVDITIDEKRFGYVKQINFDAGFISSEHSLYPEDRAKGLRCHYYTSNDTCPTPRPFHHSQRLLVGMNDYLHRADCDSFNVEAEPKWGDRCHLGTKPEYYKPTGKTSGITAGYHVAVNAAKTSTLQEQVSLKGKIVANWSPPTISGTSISLSEGSLKLHYLDLWVGLEISFCTGNARRRRLWDLFDEIGIPSTFDEWAAKAYEQALCGGHATFRETWMANKTLWPQLRHIVGTILKDLEQTGVRDQNLQAWRPSTEIYIQRVKTPWANMLVDTEDNATFAIVTQKCLAYHKITEAGCSQGLEKASDFHPLLFTRVTLQQVPRSLLTKERSTEKSSSKTTLQTEATMPTAPSKPEGSLSSISSFESRQFAESYDANSQGSIGTEATSIHSQPATESEMHINTSRADGEAENENLPRDVPILLRRLGSNGHFRQPIPLQRAQAAFEEAFPHGEYEVILTSSNRMLCGLYAIIESMKAMHTQIQTPSIENLNAIVDSEAYKNRIYAPSFAGLDNRDHFTFDQLGTILLLWGESLGCRLQLGCKRPNKSPELISYPENGQPPTVVWIYNDDAEDLRGDIGHFSGLRRRELSNQPDESGVRLTSPPDETSNRSQLIVADQISGEESLIGYIEGLRQEAERVELTPAQTPASPPGPYHSETRQPQLSQKPPDPKPPQPPLAPKITVRRGGVFRLEKNRILRINDNRFGGKTVFLNTIEEREPLLVTWEQNWEDEFKKFHVGPWSLETLGKQYDKLKLAVSCSPRCKELQDESDASRMETVNVCVM